MNTFPYSWYTHTVKSVWILCPTIFLCPPSSVEGQSWKSMFFYVSNKHYISLIDFDSTALNLTSPFGPTKFIKGARWCGVSRTQPPTPLLRSTPLNIRITIVIFAPKDFFLRTESAPTTSLFTRCHSISLVFFNVTLIFFIATSEWHRNFQGGIKWSSQNDFNFLEGGIKKGG